VLVCFRACIKQRTPFDLSKRTSQEDTDTMATVAFVTRTTSWKKGDLENCLEFARFQRVLPRCMQLRRKYCLADSCLFNPDVDSCDALWAVATAGRTKGTNTGPGRGRISFWGPENALETRRGHSGMRWYEAARAAGNKHRPC
jgi:hypothetical protein